MPQQEFIWAQTDDRFVIDGPGASLCFTRLNGCWTHQLEWLPRSAGGTATPMVSSIEVEPGREEPARIVSPVYQELQRHELAGDRFRGVCVLLTGHMLRHHFSAAVSLYRQVDGDPSIVLEIDVADRCREPVLALAATYLVRLGSGDLVDASTQTIRWSQRTTGSEEPERRLELASDAPGSVALAEAGRTATRVQALAAINAADFTHRLRYRWSWS